MKKLGWYAVSAGVAAFVAGSLLLLALNLYVQSRAVQHRIREVLTTRLRMPVTLKKTTFTPWDGLRLDTLSARPKQKTLPTTDDATVAGTFLTADSFRVQFAWTPLLRRRFVVDEVLLDSPHLSWAQDKTNRWHLPSGKLPEDAPSEPDPNTKPVAAAKADTAAASPVPGPAVSPDEVAAPPASATERKPSPPVVGAADRHPAEPFSVEKLRLRHGSMDFLNRRRGLLGRFEEVSLDGRLLDLRHAQGRASVGLVALPRAGLRLTQFQTEFLYDQADGLTLHHALAGLAGGNLVADCHLKTGEPGTPYAVQCRLQSVELDQFIKEAGGKLGLVEGQLHGHLDLNGYTDDPEGCEAVGQLELTDTQLRNIPLLQAVGDTLRIEDLRRLRFKTARLEYRLAGSTLRVQPLVLASTNLQITARGDYFLREDRLDLHARLVIDPAVSRHLPRLIERQFTPCGDDAPGSRYIEFDVTGPLSKPNSDLYERMVPGTIDGLLDSLLHSKPKRAKLPHEPK